MLASEPLFTSAPVMRPLATAVPVEATRRATSAIVVAALEPIYADHVKILGKVVGVFRSL